MTHAWPCLLEMKWALELGSITSFKSLSVAAQFHLLLPQERVRTLWVVGRTVFVENEVVNKERSA